MLAGGIGRPPERVSFAVVLLKAVAQRLAGDLRTQRLPGRRRLSNHRRPVLVCAAQEVSRAGFAPADGP